MADEKLTAATRLEKLLDNIAGGDNEVTPATRLEKFLSYIADAMEGGGGSGGGGTGGNVYNIEPIPNAEFAEGGAFYNLSIDTMPVISGMYIDADAEPDVGDIVVTDDGYSTVRAIISIKSTYEDEALGAVAVVIFGGVEYPNKQMTDTGAVTYNGKYFLLITGGRGKTRGKS